VCNQNNITPVIPPPYVVHNFKIPPVFFPFLQNVPFILFIISALVNFQFHLIFPSYYPWITSWLFPFIAPALNHPSPLSLPHNCPSYHPRPLRVFFSCSEYQLWVLFPLYLIFTIIPGLNSKEYLWIISLLYLFKYSLYLKSPSVIHILFHACNIYSTSAPCSSGHMCPLGCTHPSPLTQNSLGLMYSCKISRFHYNL